MLNNFKVVRLDGTTYDMWEMGIIVRSLNIESPAPTHLREKIDGLDGDIDLGTEYESRKIKAKLTLLTESFSESRNHVFRIFDSKEAFYLCPDETPDRQILVKCESSYSIERQSVTGEFELSFIAAKTYFETINSTLNMIIAQIGGNKVQKYTHSVTTFEILNDGDIAIDPRRYPLVIEFKGASTNLQIKNLTTGETWSYTGTSGSSDIIKLDGIRYTKNELSIFRNTNRQFITLAKGWNEFQLIGASGTFEISFDYRFYTL